MATNGLLTHISLPHYMLMANSNSSHAHQSIMKPRSQLNKRKQVSQVPAVATAMSRPRGDRPLRLAKQVQLAPGYVDSSTLLFDSDDEGTDDAKSEGEPDSEDEDKSEGDDEDRHIAKKPRLRESFKAQAKKEVSPPPPDSSCLAYYPKTYAAVQRWNKLLGLPPPRTMNDAPTKNMPKREIDAPEPPVAKALLPQGFVNKNASYDGTKSGFENLPGEIRNKIYALVFKKKVPINFMNRSGFSHSAAFLRVNKVVYNEAREFLYGENRFLFGYNATTSGNYWDFVWKELGWSHIRRFLTDIGPENTSFIQDVGISFYDATQSGNPGTDIDQRRYTYNKDLLWILDHLSQHGKILKLKLGFCGRREVRMSIRDGDFLNALKGVKTDTLSIGNPIREDSGLYETVRHSKVDRLVEDLLKAVMVRPLPLKDLDPRLEF